MTLAVTVGKKGLVGELRLVLEMDPVSCIMVLHCMLQDHDFKHLLGLGMREFTKGDEGRYMGRQDMDTLTGELADVREKFVPEMPEMLISLYSSANGIKGLPGHLLVLQVHGPIVNEGLESLSIFSLKHDLQLLPACVPVVSLISINVEGFQVV